MKIKRVSKIYSLIIFSFLYLPIFILIFFSFNESKSRSSFTGFTFKWYVELFHDTQILKALFNTIVIAVTASILATIIGTFAAVGIRKLKKGLKKTIMTTSNLPMVNPEIVTGVSLMLLFISMYKLIGFFKLGMTTLILSHTVFCVPYVILSILPKLAQLNPSLYEAAQDLGCAPVRAFFKVVLPDIMPGVLTGFIMAFTLSLDDFIISYFTSGTVMTLPIAIYSMTRKIVSPEINALSALLFLVVFVLLIIINLRQNVRENTEVVNLR